MSSLRYQCNPPLVIDSLTRRAHAAIIPLNMVDREEGETTWHEGHTATDLAAHRAIIYDRYPVNPNMLMVGVEP